MGKHVDDHDLSPHGDLDVGDDRRTHVEEVVFLHDVTICTLDGDSMCDAVTDGNTP